MMQIIKYTKLSVLLTLAFQVYSQRPEPGAVQTKSILFLNGIAHIGNGKKIEKSAIGFKDGKITVVEDMRQPSTRLDEFDEVIDITGKHVYPGFILTNTTLGLREVDAVRATLDYRETGDMKPEVRSVIAFNTDSRIIPTVRRNGVLIAQPTPRGGMVSGQSGVVHLDGWNWEDAAIRMTDGIHINWPSMLRRIYPWEKQMTNDKLRQQRKERLNKLKDLLDKAKYYDGSEFDIRANALQGLFDGSKTLYLHVNSEKDIMESVRYARSLEIQKIVLVGAAEGIHILPFIKKEGLPVILKRVHRLPGHEDDPVDAPYKEVKAYWDAGILVTVSYSGGMEAMGSRNLPFTAGTTVTYGLDKEQAVQLITLNAARVLGIDDQFGSLEVGKDATLFISSGDALDMITHNVEFAFINGRSLHLDGKQEKLYETYRKKYGIR